MCDANFHRKAWLIVGADIWGILVKNVQCAYEQVVEDKIPPTLDKIYDEFYLTMIDDIEDEIEEIFGDSEVSNERVEIAGIHTGDIPPIEIVQKILNELNLPYLIGNQLYNSFQLRFF